MMSDDLLNRMKRDDDIRRQERHEGLNDPAPPPAPDEPFIRARITAGGGSTYSWVELDEEWVNDLVGGRSGDAAQSVTVGASVNDKVIMFESTDENGQKHYRFWPPLPQPGERYHVLQLDANLTPVWDFVRATAS